MSKTDSRPRLYCHEGIGAYECLGCSELIEVPKFGWLNIGGVRQHVRIVGQPENLMLWVELHELDHAKCHEFKDADKALQAREHRSESQRLKLIGVFPTGSRSASGAKKIEPIFGRRGGDARR